MELELALMKRGVKKEKAQMSVNLNQLKNHQLEIWER